MVDDDMQLMGAGPQDSPEGDSRQVFEEFKIRVGGIKGWNSFIKEGWDENVVHMRASYCI